MSGNKENNIILSDHGDYALVTFNRPEKLNCLSRAVMDEFASILRGLREDGRHRALVIAGSGGVFSAGADLAEVSALTPEIALEFSRRGQRLLSSIGESAPVTIAAIDGHCIGGGLDIALSCDLRFASPRSTFQHPGAMRGIITGWGGTQRLPRLIGVDAARRMLVSAERIGAAEALRIGLINAIDADPQGRAAALSEQIASRFSMEELLSIRAEIDLFA